LRIAAGIFQPESSWEGVTRSLDYCPISWDYNYMINYTVFCPYAPEEQTTLSDEWQATELCLDLANEFGYACVRDDWGNVHLDYGDVLQAVEDGVI
tara:strand:+ start:404 stop:691 length:288 start_codon:yes stop_codon:yes gene_type:complete